MILAAGRGNRLRPLTDTIPKPLLKVGELSIIEHLLFKLKSHGFNEIVINLAHLGEKIEDQLQAGQRYGVDIIYSYEFVTGGLETGGGIVNALPLLGSDPFVVVSGDIWTDYNFSTLKTQPLEGLAHLVLVDNPPEHIQGDFNLLGARLTEGQGRRLSYGNIGVYHPDLFKGHKPGFFRLGPILHKAVAEGQVTGEHFEGTWVNVGTLENLAALRQRVC
ncbi:MAG: nucleotidyltransferase family protein [Gammaproteobacteria bacterium]|nr:nucleotidyltransferase family protein [Gammaproteobacteria bacterium]